jgi:hypothetical protein
MPDEPFFPLRRDQFLTFCDGEMSGSRSMRDVCIGAFAAGLFGVAGILLTIDFDYAEKQGKHPYLWCVVLVVLVLVALIVGIVEWVRMGQTQSASSYSRLVETIERHLGVERPGRRTRGPHP